MTLQIEFWQLLSLLVTLLLGGTGLLVGLGKITLANGQKHLDLRFAQIAKRFDDADAMHRAEASQLQQLERDLLTFRGEMPLHYVRREDYIRGQSVTEAKLDALASKLELMQQKVIS
jgi:hypothetical protein